MRLIQTLQSMELYDNELPNRECNTPNSRMVALKIRFTSERSGSQPLIMVGC